MIEVRFEGQIEDLTVIVVWHEEKKFVITNLDDLDQYVDVEDGDVNPYLENGEDVWVQDVSAFIDYLEGQGYEDKEG